MKVHRNKKTFTARKKCLFVDSLTLDEKAKLELQLLRCVK
jgi:hypothetical protein